jgi:hypothetical protein
MKIKRIIITSVVLLMLFGLVSPATAGIMTGVTPDIHLEYHIEYWPLIDYWPIIMALLPPAIILLIQPYI